MKNTGMKNVIVGTAGHIDHGKTALVKVLTGIDADRLEEEKRRGITIDIGFAHLQLTPELRLGFVDVPGHERFVKNMLAGVGGIDLVLFVIAAEESIKPQTREHFDICRLLGIQKGIIALTKADLVDPDILDLVRLEIEEFVSGSFLEAAPIVPVSSITGQGLDQIRAELHKAASTVAEKNAAGYFRLPVDRVFSMKGFGTVVTGTLISGQVLKDEEVEVYPSGRRLRVRGIQVYGKPSDRAAAGQRTALNLADVEPSELARGMVLAGPKRFETVRQLDCLLELLSAAAPLKHRAPVHVHAGTAEIEAEVRLLDGAHVLTPGKRSYVRIILRNPALLLPGDRSIIRRFSPVITIGGGVVLDTGGVRYRRPDNPATRLDVLAGGDEQSKLALLVRESRYGMGVSQLVSRTGILEQNVLRAAKSGSFVLLSHLHPWLLDRAFFQSARERLVRAVREFHQANPLLPGIRKEDLRSRELAEAPAFMLDTLLVEAKEIVAESEVVRLRSHKLVLQQDEEQAQTAIERGFENAGLSVPSLVLATAPGGLAEMPVREVASQLSFSTRCTVWGSPCGAWLKPNFPNTFSIFGEIICQTEPFSRRTASPNFMVFRNRRLF
jgi:selenocysteine-specific elongation factor